MKKRLALLVFIVLIPVSALVVYKGNYFNKSNPSSNNNSDFKVGQAIDSLHGVNVYYNGKVGNVVERNTKNGYNIGLKYQCVEFVKRYYYEYYQHKMPDSYGHAKSFFDANISDGKQNRQRNLTQYTNPSISRPQIGDLVVMDATLFNSYGHVAIISRVTDKQIEIIQQNPGPSAPSRVYYDLERINENKWQIKKRNLLGWLRI